MMENDTLVTGPADGGAHEATTTLWAAERPPPHLQRSGVLPPIDNDRPTQIEAVRKVVDPNLIAEIMEQVEKAVFEEMKKSTQNSTEHRGRSTSPKPYEDNAWSRAQSPVGSLYSDDGLVSPSHLKSRTSPSVYGDLEDPKPAAEGVEKLNEDQDKINQEKAREDKGLFMQEELRKQEALRVHECMARRPYSYTSISSREVRLLRIDPGHPNDPIYCALKVMAIEKIKAQVLTFQALSYAWGDGVAEAIILVSDILDPGKQYANDNDSETITRVSLHRPFYVQYNLFEALKQIRLRDEPIWLWCDALCINQSNTTDKSQQIPNMPDIYSNAWNVIVWLGEGNFEGHSGEVWTQRAVNLIPNILNLRTLDELLDLDLLSYETLPSWICFGRLLKSPWFGRRWVIQEIACARQLSVRIRHHIISWLDFTDAIDIYLHNLGRIKRLFRYSGLALPLPHTPSSAECSRAMALMEVSSTCFQKTSDLKIKTRLLDLETLVFTAASFAVSELPDIIYALLYLANDRKMVFGNSNFMGAASGPLSSNYSRHAVEIYADFVTYCMNKSNSLDIIHQPWAMWPHATRAQPHNDRCIPSWIGIASFGDNATSRRLAHSRVLTGLPKRPLYSASRGTLMHATISRISDFPVLTAKGAILGTVCKTSALMHSGTITLPTLELLGWTGSLDDGVDDQLWKTLAANRTPDGTKAPVWYRRACALALTKLNEFGHLDLSALTSSKSEASAMIDYLQRVNNVVERRKIFRCMLASASFSEETTVGIGPHNVKAGDIVCILFGCSVPLVLRRVPFDVEAAQSFRLIGTCYVHGHMEGEHFVGLDERSIDSLSMDFRIY